MVYSICTIVYQEREFYMKIMIASDIHGSAYYCEKLLLAYKSECEGIEVDKILLLGDILYHGPRNDLPRDYAPKRVIEMLNSMPTRLLCVRGNCDTEVDQMVLEFPILAEYCILYVGSRMIFATHGHNYNDSKLPPINSGDILLHGHTHVPRCDEVGGITILNPGSTSIPKEGSAHGYMILTDDKIEWKTLEGEVYMSYSLS